MTYFLSLLPFRGLVASAGLLAVTTGCTQNPPGPVITPPTPTTSTAAVNADLRDFAQYTELVWSDEFNDTSLDASKWAPEVKDVWYNNELEATTSSRNNVNVTGGNLNITAIKENYNGRTFTSGRINTKGKKDFNFGRVDVRAKLPKGKGVWPAIWMLGSNDSTAPWPACGEIDIMELRGSTPNINNTTMHFGTTAADHKYKGTQYTLPTGDFSADFHTFSVVRALNQMQFFVDGTMYYTFKSSDATPYPFNNPFYVILNLAIGGDFDGNPDANTTFPQTMQVDYVRYYQYK
jgi:beta-glucanase (GH16 family)